MIFITYQRILLRHIRVHTKHKNKSINRHKSTVSKCIKYILSYKRIDVLLYFYILRVCKSVKVHWASLLAATEYV